MSPRTYLAHVERELDPRGALAELPRGAPHARLDPRNQALAGRGALDRGAEPRVRDRSEQPVPREAPRVRHVAREHGLDLLPRDQPPARAAARLHSDAVSAPGPT